MDAKSFNQIEKEIHKAFLEMQIKVDEAWNIYNNTERNLKKKYDEKVKQIIEKHIKE